MNDDFLKRVHGINTEAEGKTKTRRTTKRIKEKNQNNLVHEAFIQCPIEDFSQLVQCNDGLRPYQIEGKTGIFKAWNRIDNVMFQMPTGTGKTVLFSSIVNDIINYSGKLDVPLKVLIIAHRIELINQISESLGNKFNIEHGIVQGKTIQSLERDVQVASIQTLLSKKNIENISQINFNFIIIDEAHHAMANSYKKLWKLFPGTKKLGLTATPWRMNKQGFRSLFDDIIVSPSIQKFITEGYLSVYDYASIAPESDLQAEIDEIDAFAADGDYDVDELEKRLDKDRIRARLLKSYQNYVRGKKGIIYAINKMHSRHICDLYQSAGVNIVSIDSDTPAVERALLVKSFKEGLIQVICNVDIFSEGFDCPDVEFIQLARPTRSLVKYLQQVGRGLRCHKNKTKTVILDNVGLYNRFGLPEANRKWKHHFQGKEVPEEDYFAKKTIRKGRQRIVDISEEDAEMILVRGFEDFALPEEIASEPFTFTENGLMGIKDIYGRVIVSPNYPLINDFSEGFAVFQNDKNKWGVFDLKGRMVYIPQFYSITSFKNGFAIVKEDFNSEEYMINSNLKKSDIILRIANGDCILKVSNTEYILIKDKVKSAYLNYERKANLHLLTNDLRSYLYDNELNLLFEDYFIIGVYGMFIILNINDLYNIVTIDNFNTLLSSSNKINIIKYSNLGNLLVQDGDEFLILNKDKTVYRYQRLEINQNYIILEDKDGLDLYNEDFTLISFSCNYIVSYRSFLVLKKEGETCLLDARNLTILLPYDIFNLKIGINFIICSYKSYVKLYRFNKRDVDARSNLNPKPINLIEMAIIDTDSELYHDLPNIQQINFRDGFLEVVNKNNFRGLYSSNGLFINGGFRSVSVLSWGIITIPKVKFEKYTVIYDIINDINIKVGNVKKVIYYNNNLCISNNKSRYIMMRKDAVFLTADSFQELVREYKNLNL